MDFFFSISSLKPKHARLQTAQRSPPKKTPVSSFLSSRFFLLSPPSFIFFSFISFFSLSLFIMLFAKLRTTTCCLLFVGKTNYLYGLLRQDWDCRDWSINLKGHCTVKEDVLEDTRNKVNIRVWYQRRVGEKCTGTCAGGRATATSCNNLSELNGFFFCFFWGGGIDISNHSICFTWWLL